MKKLLIIIGITLIIGIIICYSPIYRESVRPIKIKIIDGTTEKPIKNSIVYYSLLSGRTRNIFGIRGIDYFEYQNIIHDKYYTDSNGYITIPQRKVFLKLYEDIMYEYIYINLKNEDGSSNNFFKNKGMTNDISNLLGAVIQTTVGKIYDDSLPSNSIRIINKEVRLNEDELVNLDGELVYLVKERSLAKKSDELIIVLPNCK